MNNLTLNNFLNRLSPSLKLNAKIDKYRITQLDEVEAGEFEATLITEYDEYSVELFFHEEILLEWYCTCEATDEETLCRHTVAVLLELKEEQDVLKGTAKKKMKKKITKKEIPIATLQKAYNKLGEPAQIIVKIAALGWEGYTQTKFVQIFNNLTFKYLGKNIYPKDIKPILLDLQDSGLFIKNKDNQFSCSKQFANWLCDHFYSKDEDLLSIAKYLSRTANVSYSYYHQWQDKSTANDAFRKMRLARYAANGGIFATNYYAVIRNPYADYDQEELCNYWLPEKLDINKTKILPTSVLAFLLKEKLILQFFNLSPIDEYFKYSLKEIDTFEAKDQYLIAIFLCRVFFLMGDWEQMQLCAKYLNFKPYATNIINAFHQFAIGNNEAALAHFDVGLKAKRKDNNGSKIHHADFDAIFHIISRIKTQNDQIGKKVNSHFTWLDKNPTTFNGVLEKLKAVWLYLKNEKSEALDLLNTEPSSIPLFRFFEFFYTYWVDSQLVDLKAVRALQKDLAKKEYHWLAIELKALIHVLKPLPSKELKLLEKEQQRLGIQPLVDAVPIVEDWELAMKVLLGLGGKLDSSVQKDSRLIWLVDFKQERIQAKVQTMGKKGWTKGRVTAIHRLNQGETDCLTDQDQRIVNAIGYAYNSEIHLDEYKQWKHLVGHPLLFLWKSPEVAVQVIAQNPRLIAKADKGGFRLSFSHNVGTQNGYQLLKESPTRFILLEVSERIAKIARAFNGKVLSVPKKGANQLKEAISGLSNIVEVESAFEEKDLPSVEADVRACVHLLPVGDGFHVEVYCKPFGEMPPYVKMGQGEPTLITSIEGVKTATNRKLKKETANLKKLRAEVPVLKAIRPKQGIWELEDSEQCLELLLQLAPLLDEKSIVLEWPKGEKFRISKIVGFDQFRMEINEKNNWFEVNGQLTIDEDQVLTMQELLALSNQKSQFVELSSGKFLALTTEFRRRLEEINGLVTAQKNGSFQLHPLAAPAIQEFTDSVQFLEADKKFKESQERLKKAFSKKFNVPKKFGATLRPYQKQGFEWLQRCATWGVGACLADDMGLGKTIQALAQLTDRAKLGPALVVAPASVCRNWLAETRKFAPVLNPILFGEGDRTKMVQKAKKGDLLIATYDLMSREGDLFKEKQFATIILDEAQAIKNRATKRSEIAMDLKADFRIVMTGTPIENHLGELWNLFQFANPGLLGSMASFSKRFAIPIEKHKDQNRREQLRKLLQPFILRRKKSEVLKDLPEKTEITLSVPLSTEERAFYEALRRNAVEKMAKDDSHGGQKHLKILAEIMKLRRAACHPKLADKNADFVSSAKLDLFGEIVQDLLENDHKALVFSQFVGHLKILENYLKQQKISYQYLDGSTPLAKRQDRIDAFQGGEGSIFLISLKAGGTGLNLTAADYVIHTDPWWNPAVEDQATDRAHRIGQERPVTVYRLVAEGTIEEKILKLHEKKRDLADSLLTGTDVSAKLTANDLLNLLADAAVD